MNKLYTLYTSDLETLEENSTTILATSFESALLTAIERTELTSELKALAESLTQGKSFAETDTLYVRLS